MLKDNYKKERDGLQQLIYAIINPIVRTLIRMGVTPNMVTTIGLLGNLASACVIAYAGYEAHLTGNPRFDLIILGALSYYLIMNGWVIGALIAFLALVGSVMVSYVRARAEGVGLECKVGFMQRPERVVVTSIGCLACGITGVCANS